MTKIITAAALALALSAALVPAWADCGAELEVVKIKLDTIKDEPRREELTKLTEKAEFEHGTGRERLCIEAIEHAKSLLK